MLLLVQLQQQGTQQRAVGEGEGLAALLRDELVGLDFPLGGGQGTEVGALQGQGSGSYTLTLTNTGNVLFDTFAVALSGAPAGVTLTGTGLPGTLAPGASQDISLSLLVDTGVSPASYPFNMVITAYY